LQDADRQRNESGAEEFHAGAAVHLALERLQTIHLTLDGTVAPAVVTAASTARMSRCSRVSKYWIMAMPLALDQSASTSVAFDRTRPPFGND
jgi:hypothetical protein